MWFLILLATAPIADNPVPKNGDKDGIDPVIALLMALSTVLGGAIGWAIRMYFVYREARRKEQIEDEERKRVMEREGKTEQQQREKTIVDYLNGLNERLEREIQERQEELEKERSDRQREVNSLKNELLRTLSHVRYLEGIMETKGLKFVRLGPPPLPQIPMIGPGAKTHNSDPDGEQGQVDLYSPKGNKPAQPPEE